MNTPTQKLTKITCFILALNLLLAVNSGILVKAQEINKQENNNPEIPVDTVKENLKERLENIVKEKEQKPVISKKAWVGNLQSIANNTLTIETIYGPKLASISAETTYVKYPNRNEIGPDELEIDSYIIAMGYVNGNHVLQAVRIVAESQMPETVQKKSEFITINDYDSKTDILQATNLEAQNLICHINKNTLITSSSHAESEIDADQYLKIGQKAIIIYQLKKVNNQENKTLLRIHFLDTDPIPTAGEEKLGPEVDPQKKNETDAAQSRP